MYSNVKLQESINTFVPTIRNFNSIKKESWTRPLNPQVRTKISKNIDYGRDIWKQDILKYSVNTNLLGTLSVEKLEKIENSSKK